MSEDLSREWIEKIIKGNIDANEAALLLDWLKASRDHVELFRDNVWMDLLLERRFENEPARQSESDKLFSAIKSIRPDSVEPDHADFEWDQGKPNRVESSPNETNRVAIHSRLLRPEPDFHKHDNQPGESSIPFIIRVVLFFSAIMWLAWDGYRGDHRVQEERVGLARVSELVDVQWAPGTEPLRRGQYIDPSKIALVSGTIRLDYTHGARLFLEGPSELTISDSMHSFCPNGKLSFSVPKAAAGFEVATPFARFVDQGTEFAVQVDQRSAVLDVVKGRVDVAVGNESSTVSTTAGKAVQVSPSRQISSITASLGRYLDLATFDTRLGQYVTQKRDEKQSLDSQLDQRPGLLARLDFSEGTLDRLENLSSWGRTLLPQVTIEGGRREEGRFQGNYSLGIRNRNDCITAGLKYTFNELTMVAWVRIDQLNNMGNVLAAGQDFFGRRGQFLWQVVQDGTLQFQINNTSPDTARRDSRSTQNEFVCFDSPSVIRQSQTGGWFHLALVVDSRQKTVTHYLDGKPVGILPWSQVVPLECEGLTFANVQDNKTHNARYFDGALADFYVFDRALSPAEIGQMAQ